MDNYKGRKLNSPNDVVCQANGDILFTDPNYGLRQPDGTFLPGELAFNGLFRLKPNGELTLLNAAFDVPNGLVVTDDQKTLLVTTRPMGAASRPRRRPAAQHTTLRRQARRYGRPA